MIETKPATEVSEGDTIRLLFMGGSEDVELLSVKTSRSGLIRWKGWNSVTGEIRGVLEPGDTVRVVT